jgi:predicted nucleic acid-binding protein
MKTVLMDTVGLLALWEATDQWNAGAEHAMRALTASGARLITTSSILLECGNAASRKPYRKDVQELRETLAGDNRLVVPTNADMDLAWIEYARGTAGDAGIVDHISFVVMRRLGIIDVFSNDRHFRTAGFLTLF